MAYSKEYNQEEFNKGTLYRNVARAKGTSSQGKPPPPLGLKGQGEGGLFSLLSLSVKISL